MITGIIGGEDNRRIINGYLTVILIAIGVTGKETGTGMVEDTPVTKVILNQAGKAPVVPIIREMKDDKKDRIEDKAAKCQIAA